MSTWTPRPIQRPMIEHLAGHRRGNLWAGMGTGKTSAVLGYLDSAINVMGESQPTLVIGPKRVAMSTWPGEIRKWKFDIEHSVLCGVAAERAAALRRDVPLHTINYDNIQWLMEQFGGKGKPVWPYKRVIADESTRLKNMRISGGGRRAQVLGAVAHKHVREWHNLSGTPAPNGLLDLWGQQWFVDEGKRLGLSYQAFKERWYWAKKTEYGATWIPHSFAQEQIQDKMKDCTLTIQAKDWFDLREPIVSVIEVPLPSRARGVYQDLQRDMFVALSAEQTITAVNGGALSLKCLQAASGFLFLDQDDPTKRKDFVELHDAKLDALSSIVAEAAGMPVLVAYHFVPDLVRLKKAFPKGRVLDDNPATIDQWNAGEIPIMFAHPASAGHGLNLQDGGNILVYFSHWWDLELHDQILERIGPTRQMQAGHDRPVYVYYLVGEDTADLLVLERHRSKRSVQDLLLEATTAGHCRPSGAR